MSSLLDPFVLLQLSDPHIGSTWADPDPVGGLADAVGRAAELEPDAILVSGDLADHGSPAEYEQLRELIAPLDAPLFVLPGNHDDRAALREHFDLPGSGAEQVRYGVQIGPGRLIALDTTIPGSAGGQIETDQLEWLDAELEAFPDTPTVVAMHHPPIVTGFVAADVIAIPEDDRHALGSVLERHSQVRTVLAGHVHRVILGELGGRPVLTAPSTYVHAMLDLNSEDFTPTDEATGFAVHLIAGDQVVSHVRSLEPVPRRSAP